MSPYDVLRLHTMGSADVLDVADKIGSLEPGKLADFLIIDPARFGPVSDLMPHSSSSPQNPTSKASMSAAPSA
jgi:cytosine/adenosine deaminase-related metal-dependent hydrolase